MESLQNPQKRTAEKLNHDTADKLSETNGRQLQSSSASDEALLQQMGNSEYYQLHSQLNDSMQYGADSTQQDSTQYDGASQRQILHNTQQSFNEQREQFAEQAFNDYDSPRQPQEREQSFSSVHSLKQGQHQIIQEPDTYMPKQDSIQKSQSQTSEIQQYKQNIMPTDLQSQQEHLGQVTYHEQQNQWKSEMEDNYDDTAERGRIDIHSPPDEEHKYTISSESSRENKIDHEKAYRLSYEDTENDRLKNDIKKLNKIRQKRQYFDVDDSNKILGRQNLGRNRIASFETRKKEYSRLNFDDKYRTNKEVLKRRIKDQLIINKAGKLLKDDELSDDESGDFKRALKDGYRVVGDRRRGGKYRDQTRLQIRSTKEHYHTDKQKRLKNSRQAQKKTQDEIAKEQRRRQKKKLQKHQIEKERSFKRYSGQQFKMMKKSVTQKRLTIKRTLKLVTVVVSIVFSLFGITMSLLPIILGLTYGAGEYYSTAIVQADYGEITAATEYLRGLETDLEEYVSDPDIIESDLKVSYGADIYEFHYDLATFGFNANTIVAYLGAKYGAFQIDGTVTADLQDIFQEMYTLNVEIKQEYRDIEDTSITDSNGRHPIIQVEKKICYVKLIKKELEEVVEARLTQEQLNQYQTYKLSTGGQQVYGPVMSEDWSNKISSNYGDRIHPITGERKTHKGVDIAVPTGTKLYSAVQGTVVTAKYSSSAGNMVTIQNDLGWQVTFMHMDSYAVKNGQKVEKGDFVGYSGNTGNSTGPHLHLQVTSPGGDTINPIFIIPQTCAYARD